MKLSLELTIASRKEWLEAVMEDFDRFLQDHADCERKASAMAMSFVAKYPDRTEILPELIETAIEELEHFNDVYKIMSERGVQLSHEIRQDAYVQQLLTCCRSGREERFLDRLLLASIIECRGAERFRLVAEEVKDPGLKAFYKRLWTSEAKHGNIFVAMALNYFDENDVNKRLHELNTLEGEIVDRLPVQPALH